MSVATVKPLTLSRRAEIARSVWPDLTTRIGHELFYRVICVDMVLDGAPAEALRKHVTTAEAEQIRKEAAR